MDEDRTDFKKLVEEAAREGYNPRARRCWPWSHEWTMWEQHDAHQERRCVGCGKMQRKRLKDPKPLCHKWTTIKDGPIVGKPDASGEKTRVGWYYIQQCTVCGVVKRTDLDK